MDPPEDADPSPSAALYYVSVAVAILAVSAHLGYKQYRASVSQAAEALELKRALRSAKKEVDAGNKKAKDEQAVLAKQAESARAQQAGAKASAPASASAGPPSEFVCCITAELMRDPASTQDGQTYERAAIAKWLETHDTSPKTGDTLQSKTLIPNVAIRSQILEYRKAAGLPEQAPWVPPPTGAALAPPRAPPAGAPPTLQVRIPPAVIEALLAAVQAVIAHSPDFLPRVAPRLQPNLPPQQLAQTVIGNLQLLKAMAHYATTVPELHQYKDLLGNCAMNIERAFAQHRAQNGGANPRQQGGPRGPPPQQQRPPESQLHAAARADNVAVVEQALARDGMQRLMAAISGAGDTVLHAAAAGGALRVCTMLCAKGASVNCQSPVRTSQATPLHMAALSGKTEVAALLLDNGATVDPRIRQTGETPLMRASLSGFLELVELLLERGAEVNGQRSDGGTALHLAAVSNREEVVDLLLAAGATADAKDFAKHSTPVHCAGVGGNAAIVATLCKATSRGDANACGKRGWRPLHAAAHCGKLEACMALVEAGADPDNLNDEGVSALTLAAVGGNLPLVQFLLPLTKDSAMVAADGLTPMHKATLALKPEVVKYLVSSGRVAVDARSRSNQTSLHLAAWQSSAECAAVLIDAGADLDAQTEDGDTPLLQAAFRGGLGVAKLLIEKGAAVSLAKTDGNTALHMAAVRGLKDITRLLMENGAEPGLKNSTGSTPLAMAPSGSGLSEILVGAGVVDLLED